MGHLQNKFDRASSTYEEHSQVQQGMARTLVSRLPSDVRPASVLELACGTGHLTEQLRARFPESSLLATDASPGMLLRAQEKLGDAGIAYARLDVLEGLGPHHAALVASAALVQWLPDLATHFRDVFQALEPGGLYAVSAFCRTNFPELNAILAAPPFGYRDFPGHRLVDAVAAAQEASLEVVDAFEEELRIPYPSARAFLAMLKATGAVRAPERPPSRERAIFLLRELERTAASCDGTPGIIATWKPWYLFLRKNSLSKSRTSH